jgi:hypothetical protein
MGRSLRHRQANRRFEALHSSGGQKIVVPKTPVEKIMLYSEQARLKRDYLRREAVRRAE